MITIPPRFLIWAGLASIITFVGTLAVLPVLAARIPEDYFVKDRRTPRPWPWSRRHPLLYLVAVIIKNAAGALFLAAGFAMLFVPGQGIITMLLGLTLMNFPGKRRLERALIRRPSVHRAINWMRRRSGRPPLIVPPRAVTEGGTDEVRSSH